MTEDQLEQICFELIAYAGSARSEYIGAIQAASAGRWDEAEAKVKDATEQFMQAHNAHQDLIRAEVEQPGAVPVRIALVHAEDQMASAESFKILGDLFFDLYRRMEREK